MIRQTRPISWIKGARKDFEDFPAEARAICLRALTIAAEGDKADIVKPFKGVGSGVFEIALPLRGNAFRVVYAVQIASVIGSFTHSRRNPHRVSRLRYTKST